MAGRKGAAREREEQQDEGRYRGGMMGEESPHSEETARKKETKEERKQEITKLREERKKAARTKLCIIDVNVDGIAGVHRLLACLEDGLEAEVVVIQESRCSEAEEKKLESQLSRQGWYL